MQTTYDILIYSATPCGIAAAIAASRMGAKVLLVEPSTDIGGHSTNGINTAETEHMAVWSFGGITGEFFDGIGAHYGKDHPLFFWENHVAQNVFAEMLEKCSNITLLKGWHVTAVQSESGKIQTVTLKDADESESRSESAAVFIDASYEGDVMALAGVDSYYGRESVDHYCESLAGIRVEKDVWQTSPIAKSGELLPGFSGRAEDAVAGAAHHGVICYNFRPSLTRVKENAVPFTEPVGYDASRYELLGRWFADPANMAGSAYRLVQILGLYPRAGRKIEANNQQAAIISLGLFGGQFDYPDGDWQTRQRIVAEHESWTRGLFWYLLNDDAVPKTIRKQMSELGYAADEFVEHNNFPWLMYVREARRMIGQYVMTQRDVAGSSDDRSKSDAIAIASHFIDSHHVQRLTVGETGFVNEGRIWEVGKAYQIPYRSLLPRAEQTTNLLVPGAASFSHVAFCTYRLESTWMTTGHAAGVAGALACQADKPVSEIDIAQLQQLLRSQGQVVSFEQTRQYPKAWIDRQTDPDDVVFVYGQK